MPNINTTPDRTFPTQNIKNTTKQTANIFGSLNLWWLLKELLESDLYQETKGTRLVSYLIILLILHHVNCNFAYSLN